MSIRAVGAQGAAPKTLVKTKTSARRKAGPATSHIQVPKGRKMEPGSGIKVAVEGCCHGELEDIYATVRQLQEQKQTKIDLLIICGDFQAVRNLDDLTCMACPPKYRQMNTFYKYYSGQLTAPVLTIFIGGNHEASNHLWELYYGGWVAPNIYYLGHAGVVNFAGLRIGGLSGIFMDHNYSRPHVGGPPYRGGALKSAYHVRELEVYRLMKLRGPLDIFLSHDWPARIAFAGSTQRLLQRKAFLRKEVEDGSLGSQPARDLMAALQPGYWFSAHMHTKFAALVGHEGGAHTRFLALDKCLPGRHFLQVVDMPEASGPKQLEYDAAWLAILRETHHLLGIGSPTRLPASWQGSHGPQPPAAEEHASFVAQQLQQRGPEIPHNFVLTAPGHDAGQKGGGNMPHRALQNPQTLAFLELLGRDYNLEPLRGRGTGGPAGFSNSLGQQSALQPQENPEEIDLNEELAEDDPDLQEPGDNPEEIDLQD